MIYNLLLYTNYIKLYILMFGGKRIQLGIKFEKKCSLEENGKNL